MKLLSLFPKSTRKAEAELRSTAQRQVTDTGSYELAIRLDRGDDSYGVEHPLPTLPGSETVKLLLEEAERAFVDLYDELPDERFVDLTHLPPNPDFEV